MVHIDDQLCRSRNDEISFFIPVYKDHGRMSFLKSVVQHIVILFFPMG